MATRMPPFPFPLSDLGPCELLWSNNYPSSWDPWVLWSRYNVELLYHQRPLLLTSFFNSDGDPTVKEKIKSALQELGRNYFGQAYLVQFWGLVYVGDSRYLTTCDQPFALSHYLDEAKGLEGLCRYRKHCLEYIIALDQERELGPPGRVFCSGLPECSIDVRHYSSKEYPQHDIAVKYVKSYWAFPIYQAPGHNCIGVLEFVSSEHHEFFPRANCVRILKEVGLTTNSYSIRHSNYRKSSSCHNREMNKIAELLKVVCKTLQIRVAQTWIEANCKEQLTVLYQGHYGGQISWFKQASKYCFIQKGHGVVGKAFSSQGACFCGDIRQLNIIEYPFVPNARKYGYSSCFAICLQSSCWNSCIYTLEFLLRKKIRNYGDLRTLSYMIIEALKQHLQSSFKVGSGQKLGENLFVEVLKVSSDDILDSFEICHTTSGESTSRAVEVQNQVGRTLLDGSFQQVDATNNYVHDINVQQNAILGSPFTPELVQNMVSITHRHLSEKLDTAIPTRDDVSMEHNGNEAYNLRKRGSSSASTLESELGITRNVLEQCSALKLMDAAKALGVSRSTLKRICRRYDIHRWPPHKARKYNQATDQQKFVQPSKKNFGAQSMSNIIRLLDDSSIMVKATYVDVMIKFQLSISATKMDLDEKVAMRLNLPIGSFKIMYLDEEDDWVSITCDEDLSISLSMLRSAGKTTIKMLVSQ